MLTYNESTYNGIFDLVLTQALKEDCEREIALYNDGLEQHTFSEKYKHMIKSIEKQLKRSENIAKLKKSTPRLATAAAALIVCVALATNPTVSAFFRDIVVWLADGFARHEFIDDIEITIENFNQELRPAYLPEGYKTSIAIYSPISMYIEFIYQRENIEDDTYIILEYSLAGGAVVSIGVENAEQFYVAVHGEEAIFYETTTEDRTGYLIWESGGYAFMLIAQIELNEFVKIAESIKIS
jgi:hypothetical protein